MNEGRIQDESDGGGVGRKAIIGILLSFGLIFGWNYIRLERLKTDGRLIETKVVDYSFGRVNHLTVTFKYGKEIYRKSARTSVRSDYWPRLVGRSFPALYSEKEDVIMLLVFPDDFKKYNIKPDNIPVWVRDSLMY
ncbi:hypothetical protein [Niabella sp.]|uniref:hypothetical protein n=1 Tax=Niabella sp. TaxID=1962976 RepID=UPI002601CD86|nr:hypothetical protein [Niabella sp.]